ncbi:hypothetical protein B6A09_0965 [Saccharomyces cerevisiae synthetic construct]|uniref:Putative uncharacterized protein YBR076C-A n=1 Tax=Saccharomyces cerevisiae (strain ATCC 204508 / S288c) TaxID=559292 RepID=YB076_YEAST|nr:RecName: Full=Putative uncharacterized protein YBR076C-A [Saccharomyces cerevisiae S288C]ARB01868.1 hypothetical protein B6A09_0965 [Saccharomyces cerevisiae synthetic construct]KZV13152.1 hypothetical protein WN66_00337 [Saccharomyces cerevisiae]WNV71964.1 hypothetical protein O6U65_0208 [Saccharomyces cerevisiae synthetic construct]
MHVHKGLIFLSFFSPIYLSLLLNGSIFFFYYAQRALHDSFFFPNELLRCQICLCSLFWMVTVINLKRFFARMVNISIYQPSRNRLVRY